jgi:hypothetical protein
MSEHSGASALDAIIHNLAQPETCTCGHEAPNAMAMEGHLRDAHDMGPESYPPKRFCLECRKDLTDIMGCYVFTIDQNGANLKTAPGLLCVEHGANGRNTMSTTRYAQLTTI